MVPIADHFSFFGFIGYKIKAASHVRLLILNQFIRLCYPRVTMILCSSIRNDTPPNASAFKTWETWTKQETVPLYFFCFQHIIIKLNIHIVPPAYLFHYLI